MGADTNTPPPGGGACGETTAEDPLGFLALHNEVRRNANPRPSVPIPDLVWEPRLAESAQEWADRCVFEHSGVGENLYASSFEEADSCDAVQNWAKEAQWYNYSSLSCAAGQVCGHYTQIVWRDTERVGCAVSYCDHMDILGGPASFWVCHYDPNGNWLGEKPY